MSTQLTKSKLRKNDEVIVISGRCKGQIGKVERVDGIKNRVYVGGVNLAKRHQKPSSTSPNGGIVEKVMPLHASNVALVDPKNGGPTKIGFQIVDGKKSRFAKASKQTL